MSHPRQWTAAQQRVIDTWGQGVAVIAGAGSGKTTTLVEKCRVLRERDPLARFAAVSFTEKSAQDLRRKLLQAGCLIEGAGASFVGTIHGFCGRLLREFDQEAGLEGGEKTLAEPESRRLWEAAVQELWSESVSDPVRQALLLLWERESRAVLEELLLRVREIEPFGAFERWPQAERTDAWGEEAAALRRCGEFVLGKYRHLKRRQGALDFSDLETLTRKLLQNPIVAREISGRYALLLGDEFQDTNPVQAEILRAAARTDLSNVVVVGDPKQSIYRFRDADVSLFDAFARELSVRVELSQNFRSDPRVLDWINAVCAEPFAQTGGHYVSLEAGRPLAKEEQRCGVRRLRVPTSEDDPRGERAAPELLANFLRERVHSLGESLSEYVILLRAMRGGAGMRLVRGLEQAGIPVLVSTTREFWEDPRVLEWVALLEAYWNPVSRLSAATFLRAPWFGQAGDVWDQKIDELWSASALSGDTPVPPTQFWDQVASWHPLLVEISRLRGEHGISLSPGGLVAAVLAHPDLPEEVAGPGLALWHRLEDASESGLRFGEVLERLRRERELGAQSAGMKEIPPPQLTSGAVRVMTVHSSKGLEFPRVILVELGYRKSSSAAPLLFWHREEGAFLGKRDALGKRLTAKDDAEEKHWRERELAFEAQESRRVFYVAITRAEKEIVLVCPDSWSASGEKKPLSSEEQAQSALWRDWIDRVAVPEVELASVPPPPIEMDQGSARSHFKNVEKNRANQRPPRLLRPRHSVTEWNWLARCDRAYWFKVRGAETDEVGVLAESRKKEWEQSLGGGSEVFGTQVHAALEKTIRAGLLHGPDQERSVLRESLERLVEEWGAARLDVHAIESWWEVDQRRRLQDQVQVFPEFAFDWQIPGSDAVLVGAMDRVEMSQRGLRVLDYKVVGQSKTLADWTQLYGEQMFLYRGALQALSGTCQIQTVIISIAPDGVQEIVIQTPSPESRDWSEFSKKAEQLLQYTERFVQGSAVPARPSAACRFCPALMRCDEGRQQVL